MYNILIFSMGETGGVGSTFYFYIPMINKSLQSIVDQYQPIYKPIGTDASYLCSLSVRECQWMKLYVHIFKIEKYTSQLQSANSSRQCPRSIFWRGGTSQLQSANSSRQCPRSIFWQGGWKSGEVVSTTSQRAKELSEGDKNQSSASSESFYFTRLLQRRFECRC